MSRGLNIPYFAEPPAQYNQQYFSQLVQSFALYTRGVANPGPWQATELTLTEETGNTDRGTMSWNTSEETVDLTMGDGVVQQIGFETFMRVENDTGSQIDNGTVVGFVGANGEIKVGPYTANSSANELYFVGVATHDMPDGDIGPVTLYGKVRDIDTTGQGGETWSVGDILYASPTTAGGLTKVRPTAPNVVIPIAAVLTVSATTGVIMVRPTIPMGLSYGSFDSTSAVTIATINTATSIPLSTTLSSNGVSLGTPASRIVVDESGFYQIEANFQLQSASSSAKDVYFWIRKNGTDVPDTVRAITNDINTGYSPISLNYTISLAATEYIELYWAADSTDVELVPITGLAFAPDAPSVIINVNQLQL